MNKKVLFRRMKKSKMFLIGISVFLVIVLLCVFAPLYIAHDPLKSDLRMRLAAPQWLTQGWSGHILGTDALGRDVLSRLLVGGSYSLMIAILTLIPSALLGIVLGLISGYFGGMTDSFIMRFCDIMMATPPLMLAVCIVAILGASIQNLIITLVVTSWVVGARMTRSSVLRIRNSEYVQAAKVMGASHLHIMFHEILPNVLTPIIITESQHFGAIILTEASLGFLGLGVPLPTPSWGTMISDGREYLTMAPWIVIAPGVALMLIVLACNFLGDGIRDILDPRNKD